jgi:hypothetical protein
MKAWKNDIVDYLMRMAKHDDADVRVAAWACLEVCNTPRWKSRLKRILLNELAWALQKYCVRNQQKAL